MIKINLIPPELLARWRQKRRMARLGLLVVVGILALAIGSVFLWMRLKRLDSRLVDRQAEGARLAAIVTKVKSAESLAGALQARLRVIEDLNRGRRAYPLFMRDFVRTVPGGVRVLSMTTSGGGGAPIKLNLSAKARSNEDIASWLRRLEASGHFSGMELGPVTVDEGEEGSPRAFTLMAVYSQSG